MKALLIYEKENHNKPNHVSDIKNSTHTFTRWLGAEMPSVHSVTTDTSYTKYSPPRKDSSHSSHVGIISRALTGDQTRYFFHETQNT